MNHVIASSDGSLLLVLIATVPSGSFLKASVNKKTVRSFLARTARTAELERSSITG
ncbi:MAG: hypothetical protein QNK82_00205 [Akkermansiaceae bacterium]